MKLSNNFENENTKQIVSLLLVKSKLALHRRKQVIIMAKLFIICVNVAFTRALRYAGRNLGKWKNQFEYL